jgi:hypothetical protein
MKRFFIYTIFSAILFITSCEALKKVASLLVPSEFEMVAGLKDALSQGMFRSFDAFADPNGNPLVRFVFPGDACKN